MIQSEVILDIVYANSNDYYLTIHVRSQGEGMKPGLQHKFDNLTLFLPQTCSDEVKWAGPSISYKTTCPLSNDSDQPVQMRRLIRVIALR